MKDTEIVEKIEEFSEFLSIGTPISDMVRWLGWVFIKGLAFIVDGLESVTDDVLLVKQFFQNPEIAAFVDTIRPFLYILLAFSLLYAGYMLIFQKKFDREGMAMNLFIALIIVVALSQGMGKANEFTDEAINAINTTELYDEGEGSLSDNIISRQLTDLLEFDKNGWETTELNPPNTLPLSMIGHLSVTEKLDEERNELDITRESKDILSHKLTWSVSEKELLELEDSKLMPWTNESYYRYDVNWLTVLTTLAVMAFTLFSIAYKLARLSFELTFNYILALLVAPADIHDGQKTKKIMQSILNTFLVIILIFLSMKIYMIGTAYVAAELDGLAYLIALIAFSVAVIDGPNIVERLFGIDAGLKNGWGVLAGAYAGGKLISGAGGAVMNTMSRAKGPRGSGDSEEDDEEGKSGTATGGRTKNGSATESAASPNASEDAGGAHGARGTAAGVAVGGMAGNKGTNGGLAEKNEDVKNEQAPSPNDGIELSKGKTETNGTSGNGNNSPGNVNSAKGNLPSDEKGPQEPSQGTGASGGHKPSPNDLERVDSSISGGNARQVGSSGSAPSPNDADRSNGGSSAASTAGSVQNERMEQRTTGRTDYEVESINEQADGHATVRDNSAGSSGSGLSAAASPNTSSSAPSSTTAQNRTENSSGSSGRQQTTTNINRSGGDQTIDENVVVTESQSNIAQGSRNVTENTSRGSGAGGFNSEAPAASGGSSPSRSGSSRTINQDSSSRENIVNETTVNRNQLQDTQQTDRMRVNQSRRPRTHNLNHQESNTLDRIKNYRRNR